MVNTRNRNRTSTSSTNQNGNVGSDLEVQLEVNSFKPNNNIEVTPYGELSSDNPIVSELEPEPLIEPERRTINVVQPCFGFPYGFVPPPRVTVESSSIHQGSGEYIIEGLAVQDLAI